MSQARASLVLPAPLQRRLDAALAELFQPQGRPPEDFSQPAGEPPPIAADSLSWQGVTNPLGGFLRGGGAGPIGGAPPPGGPRGLGDTPPPPPPPGTPSPPAPGPQTPG